MKKKIIILAATLLLTVGLGNLNAKPSNDQIAPQADIYPGF